MLFIGADMDQTWTLQNSQAISCNISLRIIGAQWKDGRQDNRGINVKKQQYADKNDERI